MADPVVAKSLHGIRMSDNQTPALALGDNTTTVVLTAAGIVHAATSTAAGTKAITLPNPGLMPDAEILIVITEDNGAGVVAVDDGGVGRLNIGGAHTLSSVGDFIWVTNPGGLGWVVKAERQANQELVRLAVRALVQSNSNGAMFNWQNPHPVPVLVTSLGIEISASEGGSETCDCGVAASAAASSDTLIDGQSLTSEGEINSIDDTAGNGKAMQMVDEHGGSDDWVTGTASASLDTLAGFAYISYVLRST